MTRGPHMVMGLYIGCMAVHVSKPETLLGIGTVFSAVLGSLLPDIDTMSSKIGKKYTVFSFFIQKIWGHRGMWHSPFFLMILWFLCGHGIDGIAFVLGYGGHLLQDLYTKGGIPLLYPFNKNKFSMSPKKTGENDEITTIIMIVIMTVTVEVILLLIKFFQWFVGLF